MSDKSLSVNNLRVLPGDGHKRVDSFHTSASAKAFISCSYGSGGATASAGLSNYQIAAHVGVAEGTVRSWRERICVKNVDSKPAPTRTATRNGKSYEINAARLFLAQWPEGPQAG